MKGKWKPWVNKNLLLYCFINNPFTFGKIPQHILSTKPFSGEERMCTMLLKLIKQNKLILTLLSVFFGPRHQLIDHVQAEMNPTRCAEFYWLCRTGVRKRIKKH